VGLFSGISSALSSIGSSISGAVQSAGSAIGSQTTRFGKQVGSGLSQVVEKAGPVLDVAQFIPGPIGLAANAIIIGADVLGSDGKPVAFAGAGPAALRSTLGPATAALSAGPVANLPPRTSFGFAGFGQPSFGRPFNAAVFPGGNAGSTARSGFASFSPAVALGSAPFGFAQPAAPQSFFSFAGFRPSLARFSFLGRF